MEYSNEILKAHSQYVKAESKCEGLEEWDNQYKSRQGNARSKWRVFSDLCKAANLKPVEVAHDIQGLNNMAIHLKK